MDCKKVILKARFQDPKLNMVLENFKRTVNCILDELGVDPSSIFTYEASSFKMFDWDKSNTLELKWNEGDTVDRIINFKIGGGSRTFELDANLTVEATSTINQDATTDGDFQVGSLLVGSTTRTHLVHIIGTGLDDIAGSLLITGGTQQFIQIDSASRARFIADAHDADASIEFQEDDSIKWVVGFDYTDSLAFTISEGVPGTNNRFKIATGGAVTIGGSLSVTGAITGATFDGLTLMPITTGFWISGGTTPKTLTVEDTSLVNQDLTTDAGPVQFKSLNLIGSGSFCQVDSSTTARFIADSHDADAFIDFQEDNVAKWIVGFDYTDSNSFTISEGLPGTNNRLKIASGGAVTIGGTLGLTGTLNLGTVAAAGADTDKFLVLDGSGNVDYRTGTNVLADLSGDAGAAFAWNSQNLTGVGTIASADITVDSKLVLSAGSITDSDGAISFGDENLSTTGTLGAGNSTLGTIGCNEITVADGHGINLQEDITFTGATTVNKVIFPDNLPVALDFTEAGNSYMHFVTTNGSEAVAFSQNVGVGTPTPGRQFEILHAISPILSLQSTSTTGNCRIFFGDASDDNIGRLEYSHSTDDFAFMLGSNTKVMFDMIGGNVGIGVAIFGTNMTQGFAQLTGTVPTSSPADCFQMYSADIGGVDLHAGVHFRDETGFIGIIGDGCFIIDKTSGKGIKVDTTTPTYGWRDLLGDQFSKNTGGTKPLLTTYNGAIDAWQFSNGDEAFLTFHIPHDYVAGTDIHLHVHWSQNNAGATGGTIDFRYSAIYAKGHNQANGSAFTSTPITALFSSININDGGAGLTRYQQHFTEVVISAATATGALFDRDDFEPDGVIELTLEMDANNLTGTPSDPFIHYVDLHYQSTNIGTKDKAPDFYA